VPTDGPKIDLLPAERHFASETLAFYVVVEGMGMIGRWAQRNGTEGSVTWTDGSTFETGDCDGDPEKIVAVLAALLPVQPETERRG
jgi:hypothetical protein